MKIVLKISLLRSVLGANDPNMYVITGSLDNGVTIRTFLGNHHFFLKVLNDIPDYCKIKRIYVLEQTTSWILGPIRLPFNVFNYNMSILKKLSISDLAGKSALGSKISNFSLFFKSQLHQLLTVGIVVGFVTQKFHSSAQLLSFKTKGHITDSIEKHYRIYVIIIRKMRN